MLLRLSPAPPSDDGRHRESGAAPSRSEGSAGARDGARTGGDGDQIPERVCERLRSSAHCVVVDWPKAADRCERTGGGARCRASFCLCFVFLRWGCSLDC